MTSREMLERAVQLHQSGDLAGAESLYRRVLERQPSQADASHLLGLLLSATGRHEEALEAIRRAVALQGNNPAFHNNLAEVYRALGQLDQAITSYRQALALQPNLAEAHFNLGNALKARDQYPEAIGCYQRAVQLRPKYAKALYNLANTLREHGLVKDAAATYRQALAAQPNWAEAHLNLGVALSELGEAEAAVVSFQHARTLDPQADVEGALGNACADLGRLEEAAGWYRRELARFPPRWPRQLRLAALAEPIPPSNAYLDDYRAALQDTLERFLAAPRPPLELATLHSSGAEPPMALAYQGRDDRPIKTRYATVFAEVLPLCKPRKNAGKPHVAIVVTHGHEGVFFKCLGNLVDRLPSQRLQVTVICCRSGRNILGQWLSNPDLGFQMIPERVDQAAEAIAAAGYHLLYYWEVGTDSLNYFLPFLRPAPLQAAGWGWPATSGNPAIDFFLSSALLETAENDAHYSEQLVRLSRLPTCYRSPPTPARLKSREHFGLPLQRHVYLCTQNLRKYHPDFDPLVADILRADPKGRFVLLADQRPLLTERLLARLRGSLGDVANRVQVLPRLPEPEYLNLVAVADVVLDTLHYGGGVNTIYDAFSVGTPVVTLPGAFHRGRWALAAYRQSGMTDGVADSAEDYVRIAVRLGTEPDLQQELRRRLREASAALWLDQEAVREHEEFFLSAIGNIR